MKIRTKRPTNAQNIVVIENPFIFIYSNKKPPSWRFLCGSVTRTEHKPARLPGLEPKFKGEFGAFRRVSLTRLGRGVLFGK
jgi:hypothetical protein